MTGDFLPITRSDGSDMSDSLTGIVPKLILVPMIETTAQILTVSQLTRCIRGVIEAEDLFRDVFVQGEISNLTRHSSGHVYFSLKDANALIRCVIWCDAKCSKADLAEGMSVIARGRVSVYEKQGQYQLVLTEVKPAGAGALYAAFEKLKAKLLEEGLFDQARKKPIPACPRNIAIITSPTAAALRDMVTIARRRMPSINLLLIPTAMQGTESASAVVESLRIADGLADIDVIVVGRGGGSIEDLMSFNAENVVRAVCDCRTPVVSAIGHETDFTLCDFAADLRAPTPSAAMELIVPDRAEIEGRICGLRDMIGRRVERIFEDRRQTRDILEERLAGNMASIIAKCERKLGENVARLESLSPLNVLARGYSVVKRMKDGVVVRAISEVQEGETTETLISDGRLISTVTEVKEGWA